MKTSITCPLLDTYVCDMFENISSLKNTYREKNLSYRPLLDLRHHIDVHAFFASDALFSAVHLDELEFMRIRPKRYLVYFLFPSRENLTWLFIFETLAARVCAG